MEGADRTLGVLLEIVEERGGVAIADAVQDGQVQLHQLFDILEHASERGRFLAPGELFDRPIGQQVHVQFGAIALDGAGERRRQRARGGTRLRAAQVLEQELAQQRQVVSRAELEAITDHHGLQVVIADRGHHRILEGANVDDFVLEGIVGPPQPLQLMACPLPM